MSNSRKRVVVVGSILLLGGAAFALDNAASASPAVGMAATDRTFMNKAAQGGMAEVELGRLAEQNAQSQDVKDFGKRMIEDHRKASRAAQATCFTGRRDSACRNEREGQRYQGAAVAITRRGLR